MEATTGNKHETNIGFDNQPSSSVLDLTPDSLQM
jgi:hypothetical protein